MADFARLSKTDGNKYPQRAFEGQEDQSFGFTQARKIQTGNTRGVQTVGYGQTKIDGENNRIIITNPVDNTQIGIGTIPGSTTNEFGFFSLDEDGNVVMTIIQGKLSMYDIDDDNNERMRVGKQPDSSYNVVTAKEGFAIDDVFA